ncbi:Spy/CpxP family protein refolding chaperone [candidate division KSB1 bacterium]|nr:Spy/CpxP family protein refolding chaperone [candidate division KSB1 bacterium]
MKKYMLLLMIILPALLIRAQVPQEQPAPIPEFAWLDHPADEPLWDMDEMDLPEPEPPMPPVEPGPELMEEERIGGKLNLTDEQKDTMREMRLKHQKEMIPLQAELKSKNLDLKSAIQADKPDMAKINALVDQVSRIKADIQKKNIAFRLDMRDQLTEEQLKLWNKNRARLTRKFIHDRRGLRAPRTGHRPARGPIF